MDFKQPQELKQELPFFGLFKTLVGEALRMRTTGTLRIVDASQATICQNRQDWKEHACEEVNSVATKKDDGGMLECKLLQVEPTVLCALWPSERVVMGLRVCKVFRDVLATGPGTALLKLARGELDPASGKSLKPQVPVPMYEIRRCLRLFQHWNLDLDFGPPCRDRRDRMHRGILDQVAGTGMSSILTKLKLNGCKDDTSVRPLREVLSNAATLKRLELRDARVQPSCATLLAESLERCAALVHLDFGGSRLGDDAGLKLASALSQCCLLEFVNLAGNRFTAATAPALMEGLGECLWLKELNLSNNFINNWHRLGDFRGRALQSVNFAGNKVGPFLVSQLAAVLAGCRKLTTLNLTNTEMGDEGMDSLSTVMERCPDLRTLSFGHNNLSADTARILADTLTRVSCVKLTEINLYGNFLGPIGARLLGAGLPKSPALKRLVLGCNDLQKEGGRELSAFLPACSALEHLDLYGNRLETEGAGHVIKALGACPRLTSLHLGGNKIGALHSTPLASTVLRVLDLTHNELDSTTDLVTCLRQCPALTALNLKLNQLGDAGCAAVATLALSHLEGLRVLDLQHTDISPVGAEALGKALVHSAEQGGHVHSTLQHLNLAGNAVDGKLFVEGLRRATALRYLNLRDNRLRLRISWWAVNEALGVSALNDVWVVPAGGSAG